MEKGKITKAVLGRLPLYLEYLKQISEHNIPYISATKIANSLSLGEVKVRKDLSAVCGTGKPKLGYCTDELIHCIENCLRQNCLTAAVLVGAGRLGKALLEYDEFERYGVRVLAAFDCNERVLSFNRNMKVLPMAQFEEYCKENNVQIGIITVGEGSAQTVCDQMVASGIKAIWNFAPCQLNVPDDIVFMQENLAISLGYLNNKLMTKQRKEKKYEC